MADIPQEVREAAADYHANGGWGDGREHWLANAQDSHPLIQAFHAMFLAGKRAGMERAAEIAESSTVEWLGDDCCIDHAHDIAQAIRSESDA